jgi:hypothetical protein
VASTITLPPGTPTIEDLEARVEREAGRFDLRPLMELLAVMGYSPRDVEFESTSERVTGGVVNAIEFVKKPFRHVRVTVNIGLLGDNALLPSYFFQIVEKSADPDRFYDFIRFFDNRLIEAYYRAAYPESDTAVYRDFDEVQRSFTRMLGMGSTSTLAWITKLFFPELRVTVGRRAFKSATASHALRTGMSMLDGTGILGRVYESDSAGFLIDLTADEETDGAGRAWPHVVRARLEERLLPILAPHRLAIVVRLRVLFHASWVHMDAPIIEDKRGYLGFERLRGDAEAGHTLVIYRGIVGDDTPLTADPQRKS